MKSSCFYYGVFTEDGYRLHVPDTGTKQRKNIIVDGQSPAVKQELFGFIKSELKKNNIPFSDLCTDSGSAGILCGNFCISDSDYKLSCKEISEIIPLKNFQNPEIVNRSADRIKKLQEEKEKHMLRAQRFIAACRSIQNDLYRLEAPYINYAKINRFSSRTWQRISNGIKGRIGTETKHFVTCLTDEGSELNMEAFDAYCEKMLVISDRTGSCAGIIADRIRCYALSSGYDVISCPCTVNSDVTEHIIIPELSFGLFTSKHFHRADFENSRKIYVRRFQHQNIEDIKLRTDFTLKAYRKLMNEVFISLEAVGKCNLESDRIFCGSTDTDALKKYTAELIL